MFIYLVTELTHYSGNRKKVNLRLKFFNLGLLLIKSSFSSFPKTDKFLNEIIDYGSQ